MTLGPGLPGFPLPDEPRPSELVIPGGIEGAPAGLGSTLARLRFLYRSVERRHAQAQRALLALRQQLNRVPARAVNGHLEVDAYLAIMAEVRERVSRAEQEAQDLELLKGRVIREVQTLELMLRMQQTREALTELQDQARWDARDEVRAEIRRLQALAEEYALEAARGITERAQEPRPPQPNPERPS